MSKKNKKIHRKKIQTDVITRDFTKIQLKKHDQGESLTLSPFIIQRAACTNLSRIAAPAFVPFCMDQCVWFTRLFRRFPHSFLFPFSLFLLHLPCLLSWLFLFLELF